METISGKIYKIFSPKENEVGTIFKYCFSLKTHNNYITCYGESFELFEDETVVLEGNRKKSGNTGKEYFQFELCKVDFETIQLESNFLKKIFGKRYSTLKISFSNVEILTMLKNNERNKIAICLGLKPDSKRLAKYFEKFEALKSTYTAFETLEKYGMSFQNVQKLLKSTTKSIDEIEQSIKDNPFQLMYEFNFTFNECDIINAKLNNPFNSEKRIEASIWYSLKKATVDCQNTYAFYENFMSGENSALKKLNVENLYKFKSSFTENELTNELNKLIELGKIVKVNYNNQNIYYLQNVFFKEESLRQYFKKVLLEKEYTIPEEKVKAFISKYEEEKKFNLGKEQKEAVLNSLKHRISVITGGAGTGKTSSLAVVVKYFLTHGYSEEEIALASPTGKASARMMESINGQLHTNLKATTIHVLLGAKGTDVEDFEFNAEHKLDKKIIIIDETSMMDLDLAFAFIQAIKRDCIVIFLGDIDQLPPVKSGYFLRDLIESNIPCVKLLEVHRQKGDSNILSLSLAVKDKNGIPAELISPHSDSYFIKEIATSNLSKGSNEYNLNKNSSIKAIVKHYVRIVKKFYNELIKDYDHTPTEKERILLLEKATEKIEIVTPLRESKKDIITLNAQILSMAIQKELLGESDKFLMRGNYRFQIGSKVIITKNNHEKGLTNGQIGYIHDINPEEKAVIFVSDGIEYLIQKDELENLILAYAITVHKSQGSEWHTIIYVCSSETKMNTRNLCYTAMTRAKKQLIIFGDLNTFTKAYCNYGRNILSRLLN